MGNPILKYLFKVEYKDGTTYEQNPEDVSVSDSTRSCFFDLKQEEIKTFSLHLPHDEHVYLVDLIDGHFEIDGAPFRFHDEVLKDFRLIFFRKHRHCITPEGKELGHEIIYRMGWQTNNQRGENTQRIMEIS